MPQFVPVTDDETPKWERDDFRRDPKIQRGWQQGTVGWGVQGNFGSSSKDEGAQNVIHRAKDGESKMVKNEKGLWVKVKGSQVDKGRGRGRGGGIPVFAKKEESQPSLGGGVVYDADDYVSVRKRRTLGDDSIHSNSSSVAETNRGDRRRDGARHRLDRRSRSRSGARDHRRQKRSRSRDRPARSRSREREGRSRRSRSPERRYSSRRRSRSQSRDRRQSRASSQDEKGRSHSKSYSSKSLPSPERTEEASHQMDEPQFVFSAAQIVNRFLEVFSSPASALRISHIAELFSQDACICSMKNGNVLIEGRDKVCASFENALPRPAAVSKRIFVDGDAAAAASDISSNKSSSGHTNVSFCLDFHRSGQSPGLGHPSKDTALLYRCVGNAITHVFGMIDKEGLGENREDNADDIFKSGAWSSALAYISRDISSITRFEKSPFVHFHNYDKIDVWG